MAAENKKIDGRLLKGRKAKKAIISAAIDVFSEKGFDKAQTSEIAKLAGYAESTVFLHFKNKGGLILAIMDNFYEDLMHGANLILTTTTGEQEKLTALVRHYLIELEKQWQVVRLFGNHARYTEGETFDQFTQHNRSYTSLYIELFEQLKKQQVFKQSANSRQLRDMLFGAIEHFAIAHFRKQESADIAAFIEGTFSLLFYGASKAPLSPSTTSAHTPNKAIEEKLDNIISLLAAENR